MSPGFSPLEHIDAFGQITSLPLGLSLITNVILSWWEELTQMPRGPFSETGAASWERPPKQTEDRKESKESER